MADTPGTCVLLADRHHGLSEGIRGLLEAAFDSVFMVADEASLLEGAQRLRPHVVIVDLSFAAGDVHSLLDRVRRRSPTSRVLVLTVCDEPSVAESALHAGAHAVVLKRAIATDLLPAIESLDAGTPFVSAGIHKSATRRS
jgi:two-component system secretion response regulator SsrB